jgi:hypothetical protein
VNRDTISTPGTGGWGQVTAGIALSLLLGAAAFVIATVAPTWFERPTTTLAAAPACDLAAGPCAVSFDSRRFIRLRLGPAPLTPLAPLDLRVDSAGIATDTMSVTFSGVDMNMGRISEPLMATGGGSFAGRVTLPVCVRHSMRWRATVTATDRSGIYRAVFEFDVQGR